MKRIITILCILLTMATLLAACGEKETTQIKPGELIAGTLEEDILEDLDDLIQLPETKNEFINTTNFAEAYNDLAVRPRHMYWDGDVLVAECFVINGKDTTAYNIKLEGLRFANDDGVFADGGFGLLEGATVAPHSYITWTFRFHNDAVEAAGADLTGVIHHEYSLSFSH